MIDITVMVWHLYLFGYLLVVYVCVIIVEGERKAGINRMYMYIVADSTSLWSPIELGWWHVVICVNVSHAW